MLYCPLFKKQNKTQLLTNRPNFLFFFPKDIKEEKFPNDLDLGYSNMAAGLGLYGLAPAAAMRMAANFSSLGANPFSFPNLASSAANLASGGSAAQTAEDAMAKLWSPFFNNTATSNQQQQPTSASAQTTSSGQQPTTNSAATTSTASTTSSAASLSNNLTNSLTNSLSNSLSNNLSNIVNSSASPFASAFNPALNPLFSSLAGFQPFDIQQAMRLSAQNAGNSSANTPTSNGSTSTGNPPPLDTRSMLNAYINDLNERQAGEPPSSAATPSSSALNGSNQANSLPNNLNFDLFTAERYKAAAAGSNFFHRFFPYNFSKPFFGGGGQAGGQNASSQCNSNSSPSVNNNPQLTTSNSNGTHSNNSSGSAAVAAAAAANALKNGPFGAFGNFNLNNLNSLNSLNNLNSSFGLSNAFPGLNLNNLSSNLFNQSNPAASLANLAGGGTPMNTSLTSSTTSTTGLTANTSINSPLTPRAPSTPLSASSLSDANSLLNGSMGGSNVRSASSPRSANGQLSGSQNVRRPSSGCSTKDDPIVEDEDLENSKLNLNKQASPDDKPSAAEQLQLKNMERMVECLNQSPNGELNAGHLTSPPGKQLNGNAAIAT